VTVPGNGRSAMKSATVVLSFRPDSFRCAGLADELADEWVELVQARRLGEGAGRHYLCAMRAFLTYIDAEVPDAATASLARRDPDLHHAVTEWVRALPSRHSPGATRTPIMSGSCNLAVLTRSVT
jgi:hypothetical protein